MSQITLHEVGPRDGLQVERQCVPIAVKEAWIRALLGVGLARIQVGSFVDPAKVPQMADTDELFRRLADAAPSTTVLTALVLNEKGLERAAACGVRLVCMGVSASDTHSRRNTGMGSLEAQRRIIAMGRAALGAGMQVQVSVQSAFGCGYEGPVPQRRVLELVDAYLEAGLVGLSLADTAGHGHPAQVKELVGAVLARGPASVTAHCHDTYGLGMANVLAAMASGATGFETSFGGLGGCPFTKVPAGNVATEDLVHSLRRVGQCRDLDLDGMIGVAREVAAFFGRELPGKVYRTSPLEY